MAVLIMLVCFECGRRIYLGSARSISEADMLWDTGIMGSSHTCYGCKREIRAEGRGCTVGHPLLLAGSPLRMIGHSKWTECVVQPHHLGNDPGYDRDGRWCS